MGGGGSGGGQLAHHYAVVCYYLYFLTVVQTNADVHIGRRSNNTKYITRQFGECGRNKIYT